MATRPSADSRATGEEVEESPQSMAVMVGMLCEA
jgi:hypothetical protein